MPDVFKVSKVTPGFQSGALYDPRNYRPIATLSPFIEALERVIYDQLVKYLDKHDALFRYQSGFRKSQPLSKRLWRSEIDNNYVSCGLSLAFSKAFKTVNRQILLDTL